MCKSFYPDPLSGTVSLGDVEGAPKSVTHAVGCTRNTGNRARAIRWNYAAPTQGDPIGSWGDGAHLCWQMIDDRCLAVPLCRENRFQRNTAGPVPVLNNLHTPLCVSWQKWWEDSWGNGQGLVSEWWDSKYLYSFHGFFYLQWVLVIFA